MRNNDSLYLFSDDVMASLTVSVDRDPTPGGPAAVAQFPVQDHQLELGLWDKPGDESGDQAMAA